MVEMRRIRENAWCCGAGGGVQDAFPEFSQWTAKERIAEALEAGAQTIISSCPYCRENLRQAAEQNRMKIAIHDISEFIAEAIS